MSRRQRIDSAPAAVKVVQAAGREIVSPAHVPLDDDSRPFWNSVIGEFARAEWTPHQLELAAMLAREMSSLERNQRLLKDEGEVVASERGTPVINPRKSVVQAAAGSILSFRRSLALHARAKGGEAEKIGPRRAAAKKIEASFAAACDADPMEMLN